MEFSIRKEIFIKTTLVIIWFIGSILICLMEPIKIENLKLIKIIWNGLSKMQNPIYLINY